MGDVHETASEATMSNEHAELERLRAEVAERERDELEGRANYWQRRAETYRLELALEKRAAANFWDQLQECRAALTEPTTEGGE